MRTFHIKNIRTKLIVLGLFCIAATSIGLGYTHKVSAGTQGSDYLVSQSASDAYANNQSQYGSTAGPILSGDGRYVAFSSYATNLVPNDTNGLSNVYIKDTQTGAVTLASVNGSGTQFTSDAFLQDMNYDGRYVLLAIGSGHGLFIKDLDNNTLTSVSTGSGACNTVNAKGGAMSADGKLVTYANQSYPGLPYQAVVVDVATRTCKVLSVDSSGNLGNSDSMPGGISCDGGVISFYTNSTNLPNGKGGYIAQFDPAGNLQLTKEPLDSSGSTVSCNGNVIGTWNTSTAQIVNRLTGQINVIPNSQGTMSSVGALSLSDDGRYVAITTNSALDPNYPNPNYGLDAYVLDTTNNTGHLLSSTVSGTLSNSAEGAIGISADGSKAAYSYFTPSVTNTGAELIAGLTTGTSGSQQDVYTTETGF